jgi:hypothetical protein
MFTAEGSQLNLSAGIGISSIKIISSSVDRGLKSED